MNIFGIDVSHYNSTIDWPQVKVGGKAFAFAKATEGKSYVDDMFQSHIANGSKAGLVMGTYHFAHPALGEGAAQAQHFLSVASPYIGKGYLPPALDLEVTNGQAASTISQFASDWVAEVQKKTKVVPIIYGSAPFLSQVLPNNTLTSCKLWIAFWGGGPNSAGPKNLGPWSKWTFWQYADNGNVQGVTGQVDLDAFYGTDEDFQNLIGNQKKKLDKIK